MFVLSKDLIGVSERFYISYNLMNIFKDILKWHIMYTFFIIIADNRCIK